MTTLLTIALTIAAFTIAGVMTTIASILALQKKALVDDYNALLNQQLSDSPMAIRKRIKQEIDYDTWFDLMRDKAKALGYRGPIDRHTFMEVYENGTSPEVAAKDFIEELD
jgi:hypothetical protein